MARTETFPWGAADHLETEEDMAAYLEAALEDGDPALVIAVQRDIADVKGGIQGVREAGLERDETKT